MAALLVHDISSATSLASPHAPLGHPNELFSFQAFHGGTWRVGARPGQLNTLFYLSGRVLGPASSL